VKPLSKQPRPISLRQGRYCLFAELGSGSTATLYLAAAQSALGFDKIHALKCLRRELADEPEFLSMFVDEARLAARLEHPNVVRTVEVCVGDGRPSIVMEYVEGCSLHQLLHAARSGAVKVETAHWIAIVIEILAGLDYAHNLADFDGGPLAIVHRDISPGNVLVSSAGEVKLTDFGIAKAALRSGTTAVGTIKGKMHYMAPEQIRGEAVDARADVFAAGVLLWELVAGRSPWNTPNPKQRKLVEPLSRSVSDVTPELDAICERALASDRTARYQSAEEMLRALEDYNARRARRVSRLELGRIVNSAFGAQLERRKIIVRDQLAKLRNAHSAMDWSLEQLPGASESIPPEPTSVSLRPGSAARRVGRGRVYVTLLVVVASLFAALFLYRTRVRWQDASQASTPSTTPADPTAPPITSASQIELYVVATPPEAAIYVDGRRMPANPHRGYMQKDDAPHRVRVEAANHVTIERDVTYEDDVVLRLKLDPAPVPRKAPKPTSAPEALPTASPWDP